MACVKWLKGASGCDFFNYAYDDPEEEQEKHLQKMYHDDFLKSSYEVHALVRSDAYSARRVGRIYPEWDPETSEGTEPVAQDLKRGSSLSVPCETGITLVDFYCRAGIHKGKFRSGMGYGGLLETACDLYPGLGLHDTVSNPRNRVARRSPSDPGSITRFSFHWDSMRVCLRQGTKRAENQDRTAQHFYHDDL